MIGYVTIGVSDMEKAKAFWTELLEPLGASVLMDMGRIARIGTGMDQPMLAVCIPYDEAPADHGNGNMIALAAGSRENVDKLYAKAIEMGATDEGPAGERMPTFYGGYFRDPDGNKAVFYHMG
ncbi:MAG: glyoxalase [Gammaproteobacteria bacterium]|jgi:predicted lactoylglutathione lyase|nr:glyoxalase [Gammaproteobacteria bacterium]|tara:strand:+ start:54 stop:422 length:369 start_codon:yes stop_codon:yes gene_type:complete